MDTKNRELERLAAEVPVLMYHSIGIGAAPRFKKFVVDPGEFSDQMDYLSSSGYQTVTALDLLDSWSAKRPLPARPVVLTFDDAYADFESTALPILLERHCTATLFVATGYVGSTAQWNRSAGEGDRAILSWQALRDVSKHGIEMAAHSHTHPQLDRLSPAVLRDEIYAPKYLLEDRLSLPVQGFAYPFGYWNRNVRTTVAAAGYQYAYAVDEAPTALGDDVLTLPRLTVSAGLGVVGLIRLLDTRQTSVERNMAAIKRVAWRVMRRTLPVVGGDPREGWPP